MVCSLEDDVVVGVPALIGWQFLEGARLRRPAQTAPEPPAGQFEQRAGER